MTTLAVDRIDDPRGETLRRRQTMFALFAISMFNFIDRTILSILQVPIKEELKLSDAQIGALTGLAFALLYATCSLPIARLADRTARRGVVAVSLAVWSGMTALSGFATNYVSLVLLRMGVAIGEAGSVPASHSMILDYYPPARRATALSVWGLALPAGLMAGYAGTAALESHVGWRATFGILGGVGVLIVPLMLWLIKEPVRGRFDPPTATVQAPPGSVWQALSTLWKRPVLRFAIIAISAYGFSQYALMSWTVPFYVRSHGMTLADIGMFMAFATGIGGAIGMYAGGFLADRLSANDPRWRVWVIGFAILATVGTSLAQLLVQSLTVSLIFCAISNVVMIAYYGPIVAVILNLAEPRLRATASSLLLMVFNIVGLGLGPMTVGWIADLFTHAGYGQDGLRWALVIGLAGAAVSGLAFIYIGPAYRRAEAAMLSLDPSVG